MDWTVGEFQTLVAKMTQLENNQKVLILKLDGSIDEKGNAKEGVLSQLKELITKLDPQSVQFINSNARAEAERANQKIEELLVNQDQYFTDRIVTLEQILKSGTNDLQKLNDTVQEQVKKALNLDARKLVDGISFHINEQTSDVMNKFDEFLIELDNFKNNTGNNNLWIMIAMVFGVSVGVGIGVWLK